MIQFKRLFNSIVRESLILVKSEKNCKKCPKQTKGDFLSKIENIDSIDDSFIHFTTKFNSKDYSITFFLEYSIQKITLFSGKFNSKIN